MAEEAVLNRVSGTNMRRTARLALLALALVAAGRALFAPGSARAFDADSDTPAALPLSLDFAGTSPFETVSGRVAAAPQSDIQVTYHNVPRAAQDAFETAVQMWESYLVAPVPIRIDVTWTSLPSGILGATSSARNVKDDTIDRNLPLDNVLYPASLANQFRGSRLDDDPDIVMRLNSTIDWYLGTDGKAGVKPDLVDTALHEIAHGLGIDSTARGDGAGARFAGGMPTMFDTLLVTGLGARLVDLQRSNPGAFAAALTGRDLYFAGPAALTAVGAGWKGVKLYAPPAWEPASSVAHLDEWLFQPPSVNSLMAPAAWGGWTVHDPGPYTLAMLKDIGWEIAGAGQASRVSIGLLPPVLRGPGFTLSVPVVVTVTDPLGAPILSDNSTVVTLSLFRTASVGWRCTGESGPSKTVTNGAANYRGCGVNGTTRLYFQAAAPGLLSGNSNTIFASDGPIAVAALADDS